MFRIRDFSRFSRVSVRMLRHYDRLGLLKPAYVDPDTRYRYYSAAQLARLNRILAFRDLGFSLEHIADLLDEDLGSAELAGMLKLRRLELEREIAADRARLALVDSRLRELSDPDRDPAPDVIVREIPPVLVASMRERVSDLDESMGALFEELEARVAETGERAIGSPIAIYHNREYREHDADVEVAVPVVPGASPQRGIRVKELTRVPSAACAIYQGSYDRLPAVLEALLSRIEGSRLRVSGPTRECYLQFKAADPRGLRLPPAFLADRPADLVTEIQVPVK